MRVLGRERQRVKYRRRCEGDTGLEVASKLEKNFWSSVTSIISPSQTLGSRRDKYT